ncbi:MAG TPA: hypothetical protein PLD49_00915 [Thermoclostridium caenicola]|nr:hypothetical protein [Thermoclostridium caenicola]
MFHFFRLLPDYLCLLSNQGSLESTVGSEKQEKGGQRKGKGKGALYPAFLVPLPEVIKPAVKDRSQKAKNLGFQLLLHALDIFRADVGCQRLNFLDRFGYRPVFKDQLLLHKPELLRKRFLRFAFNEQRQDPVVPVKCGKGLNLLANPLGIRRSGRADNDQVFRVFQGLLDAFRKVG